MFTLMDLVQPDNLKQAYEILMAKRNNTILGGCAFLRLGSARLGTGIDLSGLGLDYITEGPEYIEIGAMTVLRNIETSPVLLSYCGGILPRAVSEIIGVQFRNVATIGASVFAKFGFSDIITALLALPAEVVLYKGGCMPLAEFLQRPYEKDILVSIRLKKADGQGAYLSLRGSASDFPLVNAAVTCLKGQWLITAGATPARAQIAKMASAALTAGEADGPSAAALAASELSFGTNARASAAYRREVCRELIARAIAEVSVCK